MSSEQKAHTSVPWTLTHIGGSNFAVQEFEIRGMFGDAPNTYPIFNKERGIIEGATFFAHPEDAAFIVKAVNAHEELVEQLDAVVGWFEGFEHDDLTSQTTLRMARAILAKLEQS